MKIGKMDHTRCMYPNKKKFQSMNLQVSMLLSVTRQGHLLGTKLTETETWELSSLKFSIQYKTLKGKYDLGIHPWYHEKSQIYVNDFCVSSLSII